MFYLKYYGQSLSLYFAPNIISKWQAVATAVKPGKQRSSLRCAPFAWPPHFSVGGTMNVISATDSPIGELQKWAEGQALRLRRLIADSTAEAADVAYLAGSIWHELHDELRTLISPTEGRRVEPWPHLEIVAAQGTQSGRRKLFRTVLEHLDSTVARLAVMAAPPGETGGGLRQVPPKSIPPVIMPLPSPALNNTNEGEPAKPRRRGRPGTSQTEADVMVRDWLANNATPKNVYEIKRDQIATELNLSAGAVSKAPAWKAFQERRRPSSGQIRPKQIPLEMWATVESDGADARADELKKLIRAQEADAREANRRPPRNRRHQGPS